MSIYRTKKSDKLRFYSEGYECQICGDFTWAMMTSRYSKLCKQCFDSMIDSLDDIFIYFLNHRKPTWKERIKFNELEKLVWDAFRKEVMNKVANRKKVKKRFIKVDAKYSEERRIENKEW